MNLHKKILKDAGLEHLRFHDLRHTFATTALQNGVLHAGPLRRWVHSAGLHPRHSPEAGRSCCRYGQLHGASSIKTERKMRRTGSPSSWPALLCPLFPLLSHFRVWVTVWVKNFWPTRKATFCNKKSPKTAVEQPQIIRTVQKAPGRKY